MNDIEAFRTQTSGTQVFRDMAAMLRARTGQNVTKLAYVKGAWQLGRDRLDVSGSQWGARADWTFCGHVKWWAKRLTDCRLGYVGDGFVPLERAQLGDSDEEQWQLWNNGRDPWQLQWSLPLFNQVSGEEVVFSTDTLGGRDALATLLQAYADRVDSRPADNTTIPVVELGTSSYRHPARGDVQIPVLDIVGWAKPPNKPRPPLPKAEPPKVEPEKISGPRTSLASSAMDDDVPFAPEWR
jgi:hypothetical protein